MKKFRRVLLLLLVLIAIGWWLRPSGPAIEPGSVLIVQRRHTRAQCRVMWSRQVAPGEVQIGIEFLGHDAQFWGLDLDDGCAGVWLSASER